MRIRNNRCKSKKKKKQLRKGELFFYYAFPPYKQIQMYIRKLENSYPESIKVETVGYTFQGRQLDMIIIKQNLNAMRNSVLIDAGIHAREWISVTSVLYIISQIVKYPELLDLMDYYIIPNLNPDGYMYTHKTNRLWRKNLNHNFSDNVSEWGVDLNRNFPYGYGRTGSSAVKRSFMYRGICPLSEREAQALANVMTKYGVFIKLYISFHAFGNTIMYPWGFTKRPAHDRAILHKCGNAAKNAMNACKNRKYKVGSIAKAMYLTSGCTADYAKACHDIKFAYTIELQKYGRSGFTPSVRNILEIGRECVEGVDAMVKFVHGYYNKYQF